MKPQVITDLQQIKSDFALRFQQAMSCSSLEALRIELFGKKGILQTAMQELRSLPKEMIPQAGKEVNDVKNQLQELFDQRLEELILGEELERLEQERLDSSLPGSSKRLGRAHPVTLTLHCMLDILQNLGFAVRTGPDIDSDYYNFEALNMGPDHPARDMQDTFYLQDSKFLLRTHTSNVQVRLMESSPPPLRLCAIGRCFRREDISARSHLFFHQLEAFYIDEKVTFSDLLATLELFMKRLFGEQVLLRSRPSYFPFVEPGMEVDISCLSCSGTGCTLCKQSGWLEVGGAGLIHPEVLVAGGIDPEKYSGFAWGLGVERLAMMRYKIGDIRLLFQNDFRLLEQF